MKTLLLGALALVAILIELSGPSHRYRNRAQRCSGSLLEWERMGPAVLLPRIILGFAELGLALLAIVTAPLRNRLRDLWSIWTNDSDNVRGKAASTLILPLPYSLHDDAKAFLGDLLDLESPEDEPWTVVSDRGEGEIPKFWPSFARGLARLCLRTLESRGKRSLGRTGGGR